MMQNNNQEKLIAKIKDAKAPWRLRLDAAKQLARKGLAFAEIRDKILEPKDPELTFLAMTAIPDSHDADAERFILLSLSHPAAQMREAAAANAVKAIKRLGDAYPLLELLDDPDFHVRLKAIWALGLAENETAVKPLAKLLKDPDEPWQLKYMSVEALGRLKAVKAGEEIAALLKTGNYCLKTVAAKTLGELGYFPAIEALVDTLAETDAAQWDMDLKAWAARSVIILSGEEPRGNPETWTAWWETNKARILAEGIIKWCTKRS